MSRFSESFKDAIRDLIAKRVASRRSGRPDGRKRALIAPASNPGSLGDAAMIIGLITLLKKKGGVDVALVSDEVDAWQLPFEVEQFGAPPAGGFSWFDWGKRMSEVDEFFLNGADVLDGKYSINRSLARLKLVDFAAKSGIPATITGFSLRQDLPEPIIEAFRKLPASVRLCLRDPVSKGRMETLVGRECHQVADLAFLVQPAIDRQADQEVVARIASAKAAGKTVIGFCPNLHAVVLPDASQEERCEVLSDYFKGLVELCRSLVDPYFVFLPHDYRGQWNDAEVSRRIRAASGLDESACLVADHEMLPTAIKGIAGELDVLITGRMHCGIAGLGRATPTIFMDYQGKVDGLLEFFGLKTKVRIERDVTEVLQATEAHLREIVGSQGAFREKIAGRLASVQALSSSNWG